MQMNDNEQYLSADPRQFMASSSYFQTSEPFTVHQNLFQESLLVASQSCADHLLPDQGFTDLGFKTSVVTSTPPGGLQIEGWSSRGECGNSRWPREETLVLLEIRSQLDYKFKEANNKGPLWDEVSWIMRKEYGYQRSGKKCREKFENLYKYYKKTKEAKANDQRKNYRFFHQLEALYGKSSNQASSSETLIVQSNLPFQTNNNFATNQPSKEILHDQKLFIPNLSEFETSNSSENNSCDLSAMALMMKGSFDENKRNGDDKERSTKIRKSWKRKMKGILGTHMQKLMERQETWMEKMLRTIERREEERIVRQEEWRKQEMARHNQEYELLANKRAWVEAGDTAFLGAFQRFVHKELKKPLPEETIAEDNQHQSKNMEGIATKMVAGTSTEGWLQSGISKLIQLKANIGARFQESDCSNERLWQTIALEMACLGYKWSAVRCKETWENINFSVNHKIVCRSHQQNSRTSSCLQHYDNGQEFLKDEEPSLSIDLRPNVSGLTLGHSDMGKSLQVQEGYLSYTDK